MSTIAFTTKEAALAAIDALGSSVPRGETVGAWRLHLGQLKQLSDALLGAGSPESQQLVALQGQLGNLLRDDQWRPGGDLVESVRVVLNACRAFALRSLPEKDAAPPVGQRPTARSTRKYQVFISSTYEDLREERQAVSRTILKLGHIPVGMEAFPADDDRGWQAVQTAIDETDYYVLVVGWKYGSLRPGSTESWTHREYRYAREKGIPVLAFLRSKAATPGDRIDEAPRQRKRVTAFRDEIETTHKREEWTTAESLCTQVAAALHTRIRRDEHTGSSRPGWYRGTPPEADIGASSASSGGPVLSFASSNGSSLDGRIVATRRNRTIVVALSVRNTGQATARDVSVEIEFKPYPTNWHEVTSKQWGETNNDRKARSIRLTSRIDLVHPGAVTPIPALQITVVKWSSAPVPFRAVFQTEQGPQGAVEGKLVFDDEYSTKDEEDRYIGMVLGLEDNQMLNLGRVTPDEHRVLTGLARQGLIHFQPDSDGAMIGPP